MLSQQAVGQLGGSLPGAGLQTGIPVGELGLESGLS
jgi:hypothetical protein